MTLNFERISVLKTNIWSKTKNLISGIKFHKMTSVLLLSIMLPMAYASHASSKVADEDTRIHNLKLSTNSSMVIVSENKISEIKPGESKIEREAREKAEADAKTKALARNQTTRNVVTRENRVYSDPSNFDEIYARASARFGVDARILKAIHIVETGASGSSGITNHTGSGATGPMQFLPSTWRRHAVDGNGDGITDINNVEDAVFSAAAYLNACGYPNVQKALWGYNPSTRYYNKIMGIASSLGY